MRCLHCSVVLLYHSVPAKAHSNQTSNLEEWPHWSEKLLLNRPFATVGHVTDNF